MIQFNKGARTINGKYLTIDMYNLYLNDVATMLLEYYDTEEYQDSVILLCSNLKTSCDDFRKKYPGKKIIIYQLEQLVTNNTGCPVNWVLGSLKGADEIWDYDAMNLKYFELYTDIKNVKFMPLRYTESLINLKDNLNTDIDLVFYGGLNERRVKWLTRIQNYFWNSIAIYITSGNSIEQTRELLERAKVVLNIHGLEPYHRQEQVRMFHPIINGKTVLSEQSQLNHLEHYIMETELEHVCEKIKFLLLEDRYKLFGTQAALLYKMNTQEESNYEKYKVNILNKIN